MRKLMIVLAFAGFAAAGMAQESFVPVSKYKVVTNTFWANWFVQVGGQYNASFTSEEDPGVPFAPFTKRRGEFGFNVAVGKWFTPGIGLRTKFEGIWADRVINRDLHDTYQYYNIHEDVMFNLSNIFCGYNEKRVWNFIPYVGVGFARNMTNHKNDISYQAGLLNTFRISNRVGIFLDIYATAIEGSHDQGYTLTEVEVPGYTTVTTTQVKGPDPWRNYKKSRSRYWDKMLSASIGLTFNLGKCTWEKAPDVDALMAMNKEQLDALQRALKAEQDETARLRDLLANQPGPKTEIKTVVKYEKEVVSTPQSIFFNLASSKIASQKELINLKEIAAFAKENNCKVLVTGYADSATGNDQINNRLSRERADAVAAELVKLGVDQANIETAAKGGVADLEPAPYNRRATVQLK